MKCQTVTDEELDALLPLATQAVVLEVGSWFGASTVELCKVAREVWSVDWHGGQYWQRIRAGEGLREPSAAQVASVMTPGGSWSLPGFLENTAEWQAGGRLVTLIGPSHRILPRLALGSFDLIFQDADHSAEGVASDLRLALPLLHRPGYVAVHDYGLWGVRSGADSILGPPDFVTRTLAVWGSGSGR